MTGPISRHVAAEKYVIFTFLRADTCLFFGISPKIIYLTQLLINLPEFLLDRDKKNPHLIVSDIVRANNVNSHSHLHNASAIKTHRFSTNVHLQVMARFCWRSCCSNPSKKK